MGQSSCSRYSAAHPALYDAQRNLLYTGVTRAPMVVLVGSRQAAAPAVRNDRIAMRNTRLACRMKEYKLPKGFKL